MAVALGYWWIVLVAVVGGVLTVAFLVALLSWLLSAEDNVFARVPNEEG